MRLFAVKRCLHTLTFRMWLILLNAILFLLYLLLSKTDDFNKIYNIVDTYQTLAEETLEVFDYMKRYKSGSLPKFNDFVYSRIEMPWCWSTRTRKPLKKDIRWLSGGLWQSLIDGQLQIYLYSAFWDTRPDNRTVDATGFVRILGIAWRSVDHKLYCHLWWHDGAHFVVEASILQIWERSWDPRNTFYFPYLFSCPLPKSFKHTRLPAQVSLAVCPCCHNLTNLLDLFHEASPQNGREHTVVCVKGMDFLDDLSFRLIEWLEANYILGAHKIVIYTYAIHPKMQQVIDFYTKRRWGTDLVGLKRFESLKITLPGRMPDNNSILRSMYIKRNRQQKRRNELIPYNDCIYRHLYTHRYALIVDIDELVVPLESFGNWKAVLDDAVERDGSKENTFTAFSVANAFFFDNLTKPLDDSALLGDKRDFAKFHMLSHNVRSRFLSPKGLYGKSFVNLDNSLTVFNHYPLHKLSRHVRATTYLRADFVQKNHYKANCPVESTSECPKLFQFTSIDYELQRFRNQIERNVGNVLRILNM